MKTKKFSLHIFGLEIRSLNLDNLQEYNLNDVHIDT